MKRNSALRTFLFYAILIGVVVLMVSGLFSGGQKPEVLTYDDVIRYIENKQASEIVISNKNVLTLKFTENGVEKTASYKLKSLEVFQKDLGETVKEQVTDGTVTLYEIQPAAETPWWLSWLPWILVLVAMIAIWIFSVNAINGKGGKINSFGRARVKTPNPNDKNKVLFRDVAGADEEKAELEEIVDFLREPARYTRLGAKIPHGVLLVGPPGTGKTLLAKAVAGEAGVPFFSISGSDFVEMYVGVGASRVRDLFETARRSPAAIIFIDEIDAVGRHRGAGLGGGHDEREQTLNQLLVEMDGFGSHDGVIVMAATNRPDILDPALLRPGRFDRQVTVNLPDIKGREAILAVHARNKPLEMGVDFHKVAQNTVGFSGADLANLLNEAALLAAKRGKQLIGMDEIQDSYMKAILGPQKKTRIRTEEDNRITAYHEAGHAVVSYYCKKTDPVKVITIIPAGNANGVTVSVPERDKNHMSRGEMLDDIRMVLGGRIAEELVMDDITTGASADIQHATKRARAMVTRYGMSAKLGTVLYGSEHSQDEIFLGRDYSTGKDYSEATASTIDAEILGIVNTCYADAKAILSEHIDKLHFVAEYLLKHESMDGDEFAEAMKDGATVEDVERIAEEKAEQSRKDNEAVAARRAEEEKAQHPDGQNDPNDPNGQNGDGGSISDRPKDNYEHW